MNVLITGGSRGIGAAAVRSFCALGADVRFFYQNSTEAAQLLADETGAQAIRCDVSDEAAVKEAFSGIGRVGVLINNAGKAHYGLLQDMTAADWRSLFAVNVDGMFYCIKAALPAMLRKKSGCIINVSSMWGQVGASCEAAYSATKGAVLALTKALAQELGPSGIRVNAIAPGVIQTDMCASLEPETLRSLSDETPLGRLGTPEDVAQAMVYLAQAQFVTGQTLAVNGGFVIT